MDTNSLETQQSPLIDLEYFFHGRSTGHAGVLMTSSKVLTLNGIFAVFKPVGITSSNVVEKVKHSILSNLGPLPKRWSTMHPNTILIL